jgi:Na+/proline symporter
MRAPASATVTTALDSSQVKNVGLGAIIVIILLGLLLARLVPKMITRVVVLLIAVVLAVVIYQQRDRVSGAISDRAKRCEATFFGVHVQPHDPLVRKACDQAGKLPSKK